MAMLIGAPAKLYYLDMDTGSDLTWLQCDAPCRSCAPVSPLELCRSLLLTSGVKEFQGLFVGCLKMELAQMWRLCAGTAWPV